MSGEIIDFNAARSKRKSALYVFLESLLGKTQLAYTLRSIRRGEASNSEAQELAASICLYASRELQKMEDLFFEVQADDIEHHDIATVEQLGAQSRDGLDEMLVKFSKYPVCIILLNSIAALSTYQELYIKGVFENLLEARWG